MNNFKQTLPKETDIKTNTTKQELVLGLNDCSNEIYHANRTYLSSSTLKTILKNLAQYEREYLKGIAREPYSQQTLNAFDDGSLAHSLILEPNLICTEYAFYPGAMKSGAAWEDFKQANAGLRCMSARQRARVQEWVNAYYKHPVAPKLMTNIKTEFTICAHLNDVPVKVRFDAVDIDAGMILDVKTTSDSNDVDNFKMTIDRYSYDLSAALYTAVAEQFYGKPFEFYFIVLSKRDCSCEVYKASKDTMFKGRTMVNEALLKYKKALATNNWTETPTPVPEQIGDYEILEV